MIAVVQRVTGAAVTVEGKEISRIGRGLLVFVGVAGGDQRLQRPNTPNFIGVPESFFP